MKYFYDIESNEIVSEKELENEYSAMANEENISFDDFILNCHWTKNGTLETMHEHLMILRDRLVNFIFYHETISTIENLKKEIAALEKYE